VTSRAALLLACVLAAGCSDTDTTGASHDDGPASADGGTGGRLVTLAPHLTELVYAAGAGDQLVGVSAYSNYPAEARELGVVSDAFTVDLERLALLEPTVVLAWESGTPGHVIDELRDVGYRVESIRTRGLEDVAAAVERIGDLSGETESAYAIAAGFRDGIESLRRQYAGRPPISVFYQVSARPLFTVGNGHYIDEVLSLCGGRNVFADLGKLAPSVTVEAVVARDPEIILAGADGGEPFTEWRRWPDLAFNRYANRFTVPADEIGRATPRLVAAARAVCTALDEGRRNRRAVLGEDDF